MGLRINTNVFSQTAQRNLFSVSQRLQDRYSRLSSGLRIASAKDDPAGLGISERMRAEILSLGVAERNIQDAVSLVRTADGVLGEITNLVIRARELVLSALSGQLNTEDKSILNVEYHEIAEEITRQIAEAEYNGIGLLDQAVFVDIQVGTDAGDILRIDLRNFTGFGPILDQYNLTAANEAQLALTNIDVIRPLVSLRRGAFGAFENRLTSALAVTQNQRLNLSAAESRIRDVDVARETAELVKDTILQQAAISVLKQANLQPELALLLLQPPE